MIWRIWNYFHGKCDLCETGTHNICIIACCPPRYPLAPQRLEESSKIGWDVIWYNWITGQVHFFSKINLAITNLCQRWPRAKAISWHLNARILDKVRKMIRFIKPMKRLSRPITAIKVMIPSIWVNENIQMKIFVQTWVIQHFLFLSEQKDAFYNNKIILVLLFCNCLPLPMKEITPSVVIFSLFLLEIYYSRISIVGNSSIIFFIMFNG